MNELKRYCTVHIALLERKDSLMMRRLPASRFILIDETAAGHKADGVYNDCSSQQWGGSWPTLNTATAVHLIEDSCCIFVRSHSTDDTKRRES